MTHMIISIVAAMAIPLAEPTDTANTNDAKPTIDWTVNAANPYLLKGQDKVYALINLKARSVVDNEKHQPLNLSLVLDRSGSMQGQKIADARQAALEMVQRMRDGDRVSVVSYATDVRVDVPSTVLTEGNRRQITAAIHSINADDSTNLSGGLIEGIKQVRNHWREDVGNRVLLISDGLANQGITDVDQLSQIARREFQKGVMTTTIGVGADYNEGLMTAVANHGGGNYHFLQDSNAIADVLNREVKQMMTTVARQVSIVIETAENVELTTVYGWQLTDDGATRIVRLAELFAEQSRSVLCEFKVSAPVEANQKLSLGKISLHYQPVTDQAQRKVLDSEPIELTVTEDEALVEDNTDQEVLARIKEIQVAMKFQRASELLRRGKYDEAQQLFGNAAREAEESGAKLGAAGRHLSDLAEQAGKLAGDVDRARQDSKARKLLRKESSAEAYDVEKR